MARLQFDDHFPQANDDQHFFSTIPFLPLVCFCHEQQLHQSFHLCHLLRKFAKYDKVQHKSWNFDYLQDKFKKEFKHKLKWKTIKRLLTGARSISRIEDEVAMIPLNNIEGQVLSSGLRAHRVGPKSSGENIVITDIQDVSPEKENITATISYGNFEKLVMGTYV